MDNSIMEQRNKRMLITAAKVGGVGVVGFVIAPLVFIAIQGIIGVALAIVVGFAAIYLIPIAVDWLASLKLKGIKLVATRNPIETLENDFIKRKDALSRFLQSIKDFNTAILAFNDKLADFKSKYPSESDKFADILTKMKQLLAFRKQKYKEAEQSLDAYSHEIEKANAIWAMSQEAAKVNAASGLNEEDVLQKIKVETSLDSIQKNMNSAFTELELSLEKAEDEKQLSSLDTVVKTK